MCLVAGDGRAETIAGPPAHLICPISLTLLQDPVKTPAGHTFSRKELIAWVGLHGNCPLTRQPLSEADLVTDRDAEEQLAQYHAQYHASCSINSNNPPDAYVSHPTSTPFPSPTQLVKDLAACSSAQDCIGILQRLQEAAWSSDANKMDIARAGGVDSMIHILTRDNSNEQHVMEMQWHAAEVLSLLALVDVLRASIISQVVTASHTASGDMSHVACLNELMEHVYASRHAEGIWNLWLLSLDADLRAHMLADAQLINTIKQCLHTTHPACFAALRLVRSLALADGQHQCVLKRSGVLRLLVDLLGWDDGVGTEGGGRVTHVCQHISNSIAAGQCCIGDIVHTTTIGMSYMSTEHMSNNTMHIMAACSALCNTAIAGDATIMQHISDTCTMHTLGSMLRHTSNVHVQGWAARMVRLLVIGAGGRCWVLCKEANIIPALLHMLAPATADTTRVTACSALQAMVEMMPQARADLPRQGALELLAALVGSQHYPLRFLAARTMAELACPASHDAFKHPLVCASLERLLQDACDHCQYCAAVCLLNTSHTSFFASSSLVLQDVDAATLRGLIRLLSSVSGQYRCAAAAVLRQLARVEVNRPFMVKVGAIHALLEVVAQDAGRSPLEAVGALQQLARTGSFYRNAVIDAAQGGKIQATVLDRLVGQLYSSRSS